MSKRTSKKGSYLRKRKSATKAKWSDARSESLLRPVARICEVVGYLGG